MAFKPASKSATAEDDMLPGDTLSRLRLLAGEEGESVWGRNCVVTGGPKTRCICMARQENERNQL